MDDFKVVPQLGFGEALKEAKEKLTQFTGRSRRSEFWWCYLAVIIANIVLSFIPFIGNGISSIISLATIPLVFRRLHDTGRSGWWCGVHIIGTIIGYTVIFASIGFGAAMDIINGNYDAEEIAENISGGAVSAIMISFIIGIVYNIVMLVFLCQDSQMGPNKYGESPKYVTEEAQQDTTQGHTWE